ncbi:MAG: DNA-directed RNA polymerase subunit beta [Planctomycetes bacterium]|nr:DNA-directed RNA polymerase subunit beta [Planctomycetota bacterium]
MKSRTIRNFGKIGDGIEVPNLTEIQRASYRRFIQDDKTPEGRERKGFEALLREIFPIVSYDKNTELEFIAYELEKPRYTVQQCRELRLTYGHPLKIRCRLNRVNHDDIAEQSIYLGEMPIMIGGGEFIINGAERVIVNQLHRSPGVDFGIDSKEGEDRIFHGCRIIPERGSWIELAVTRKDRMVVRIDQSSKIPATTFLRAMSEDFGTTESIVRLFYETKKVKTNKLDASMWSVGPIVDTESGEVLVSAGCMLGDSVGLIQNSELESVEVVKNASDALILNTISDDECESHEEALLKLYMRLRPGNPAHIEKAKQLFVEKFFDENRYRLGKVGRFRLNRKFGLNIPESEMTLKPDDFLNTMKYIIGLRRGEGCVDDIDHLGNRRLRTIDELAADEIRKGLLKLRRTVQERMSMKSPEDVTRIADLVNSKSVSSSIDYFFGRGELSQVVDQTNALSQLTHERRLSALGPGGLNRKRAGFEVRDVHISHYGRVCPIETPEGTNIGLIVSLGIFAKIDEYGFLITPYRKADKMKVTKKVEYLRADQEMTSIFAPPSMVDPKSGSLRKGMVLARCEGDLSQADSKKVDYVDISPKQTVGVSAALIPFLEHDDANRALMGSNMMRQSVPLLITEQPFVGTGMESDVARNSSMVVKAINAGVVTSVDCLKIVIDETDEYDMIKYAGLNERTCLTQKPLVSLGDKVKAGQIIADGGGTNNGVLSLGKNLLVAFVPFDGYNFEDAMIINERLVKDDVFTSIHIDEFSVDVRETKLGREEFTCDIPNVSEKSLRNLNEYGIVCEGTRVSSGDILVGKVSPKSKTELTPEEKLLHAIFGRAGEDVKNDSLEVPSGTSGVVIGTRHFMRRGSGTDEQKLAHKQKMSDVENEKKTKESMIFKKMIDEIQVALSIEIVDPTTLQKAGVSDDNDIILEQIENFTVDWVKPAKLRKDAAGIVDKYMPKIADMQEDRVLTLARLKHGDELQSGVLEMVKIYIATKRTLSIGDKMAGRHGNKGVIAKIIPQEDMPFLEDGTPVDICLNPLGVPSRMNVGQILETLLGWSAKILGVNCITPVFDGASEKEIHSITEEANNHVKTRMAELEEQKQVPPPDEIFATIPDDLKVQLYDGRTGEALGQDATIGYMYMLKLHHLVDEKIHARATGPYSLITQQPLGGKARTGGQRFGEMEVWALEAYGAAYTLQELLTVKSDDIEGRTKIYESMVKGNNKLEAGTPISFDVLCNEIRGLCLNIQLEKKRLGSPL